MLQPGKYLLLSYDYVPDILDRRGPHREAHLAHARAAKHRGLLLNVGAVGDPPHGAVLVFAADDRDAVESYGSSDPYALAGLITSHRIEPWTVVV